MVTSTVVEEVESKLLGGILLVTTLTPRKIGSGSRLRHRTSFYDLFTLYRFHFKLKGSVSVSHIYCGSFKHSAAQILAQQDENSVDIV
jgi:hypothetical protein